MSIPIPDLDDDEAFLDLAVQQARQSPGAFMYVASRGTLGLHPHVQVMDDAIASACAEDEGRLMLSVTVRAGKSTLGSRYTPAWYLGNNPTHDVILASHEAGFAAEHGGVARDILREWGPGIFGVTVDPSSNARNRWKIAEHGGGMRTVGAGGSPIGRGARLMVADDVIKSLEQALNDDARRKINETWWQGVMESRIEPGGTVIVIMSRWHEDDLSGWLKANYPGEWREVSIPALCTHPDTDALGRAEGESFWPTRWTAEKLEQRHKRVGELVWSAQYLNDPQTGDGEWFPIGKLRPVLRPESYAIEWCRGWDFAASEEPTADATASVLLGRYLESGRFVIADVTVDRVLSSEVRKRLRHEAEMDGAAVRVDIPQDPAQAGKDQAAQLVALLAGFAVHVTPQTPSEGSKQTRALGASAQVQAGAVDVLCCPEEERRAIVAGIALPDPGRQFAERTPDWYQQLVAELRPFPRGRHDDIVDAFSAAFNNLAPTRPEVGGMADADIFGGAVRTA